MSGDMDHSSTLIGCAQAGVRPSWTHSAQLVAQLLGCHLRRAPGCLGHEGEGLHHADCSATLVGPQSRAESTPPLVPHTLRAPSRRRPCST